MEWKFFLKISSAGFACYGTNCGINCLFLLNKVNHLLNLNLKLKFQENFTATAKISVYNFMVNRD